MDPARKCLAALLLTLGLAGNCSAADARLVFQIASRCVVIIKTSIGHRGQQGSGVIAWSRASPSRYTYGVTLLATNAHLVGHVGSVALIEHAGRTYEGRVVYSDHDVDLAAVEVPNVVLPACEMRTSSITIGEPVFAIGSPLQFANTITQGITSGKRTLNGVELIQFSAAISPGSSGGGLFDETGKLIGLTTFKVRGGENLNFAVSGEYLRTVDRVRDAAAFVITLAAGGSGDDRLLAAEIDRNQGLLALWFWNAWRRGDSALLQDIESAYSRLLQTPKDDTKTFSAAVQLAVTTYERFLAEGPTPQRPRVSDTQWVRIEFSPGTWFADIQGIKREGHLLFVTIVRNDARPDIERKRDEPVSVVMRHVLDCNGQTEAGIGFSFHAESFGGGTAMRSFVIPRERWKFEAINPARVTAPLYKMVCE